MVLRKPVRSASGENERREKVLSEMGLRIVRFGNDEVVRNLSAMVGKIRELTVQ